MVTNYTKILNVGNYMNTKLKKILSFFILLTIFSLYSSILKAITLDDIKYASLPGDRVQIILVLSEELLVEPLSFTIDNPARVVLDFPKVGLNLAEKYENVGVGMVSSINAIEAAGRTRVVLNLIKTVSYNMELQNNNVILHLDSGINAKPTANLASGSPSFVSTANSLENIDFRRGESGEGRIIVKLSDPSTPVDIKTQGGKVVVSFIDAKLPPELDRKLDVVDFATPVKEIDTVGKGNNTIMTISAVNDEYTHIAYQTEKLYTIEFKPLTKEEIEGDKKKKDKFDYTGERLSLNFQNIEVRAVLQLIADFTGFNMVTSDAVTGAITLRMKNVPWDQALDIILKARGLGMRKSGNIIMVAPQEEIAARERAELEANKQVEELAPLLTEFIKINYADANDLMTLIQARTGNGEGSNNLLSDRGSVSIDERTNTLVIQDVASSLASVRVLITELDIPVRQILIESRIVNAEESFVKDIGVRFGYSHRNNSTDDLGTIGGGQTGDVDYGGTTSFNDGTNENYIVDLPAAAGDAASLKLAVGKIGSYLLQLELSALIAEGRGEDIASPRVITANKTEAVIESGTQIPYQNATSSGATSVSFQDAVLSLKVTPQITPDDTIIMDLEVSQDTVSALTVLGVPAVNTRSVSTQVLVDNGETVVLGGVYNSSDRKSVDKVPFFGDLPYIGFLFKRKNVNRSKNELLIFITPKILKDSLSIQ